MSISEYNKTPCDATFVCSCVQDVRIYTTVGHHGEEDGGAVEELLVSILQLRRIPTMERSAVMRGPGPGTILVTLTAVHR